jgi:hypothetical protein
MPVKYQINTLDDEEFLVILSPTEGLLTATRTSHGNYDELVEAARAQDEEVFEMFEVGKAIERKFEKAGTEVNGRITVRDGVVYFDDDPLDDVVAKKILAFWEEDEDFGPLARYVENIMANPEPHSREQLYRWLEHNQFPISNDGCIVGYKSVTSDHLSHNSGHAFVDGIEYNGRIPNHVGAVVTMPRSEVAHDPNQACHVGLHVGTWEYASTFGGGKTVMLVKINPRDVVSVPHDASSQKVRVCRYEVIGYASNKDEALRYLDDTDFVGEEETSSDYPEWAVGTRVRLVDGVTRRGLNSREGVVTERMTSVKDEFDDAGEETGREVGACYVKHDSGELFDWWDDQLEEAPKVRDTRENYKFQPRGPGGRFAPKGS